MISGGNGACLAVINGNPDANVPVRAIIHQGEADNAPSEHMFNHFNLARKGCRHRTVYSRRGDPFRPHPDERKTASGQQSQPEQHPARLSARRQAGNRQGSEQEEQRLPCHCRPRGEPQPDARSKGHGSPEDALGGLLVQQSDQPRERTHPRLPARCPFPHLNRVWRYDRRPPSGVIRASSFGESLRVRKR